DFPPMGGGIARLHGEMAKRYPAGQLVVSTPQDPDAADFDAQLDGIVDRLPVGRRRTKSLPGLLLWSRRAATLAPRHKVRFMPGVDPTELRERLGLPEDGVRWMLTVARLTPHKGADTVLRALPAILEHAPDVRYAVAGSGPALDQLEELASAIGVADRVSFLGSVSDRDLPALYNLASVYVGASRLADRIGVEGFGISLVEASACGLPVVAGNSGGIPDAVRDGETGFLVPPEDPAAL